MVGGRDKEVVGSDKRGWWRQSRKAAWAPQGLEYNSDRGRDGVLAQRLRARGHAPSKIDRGSAGKADPLVEHRGVEPLTFRLRT